MHQLNRTSGPWQRNCLLVPHIWSGNARYRSSHYTCTPLNLDDSRLQPSRPNSFLRLQRLQKRLPKLCLGHGFLKYSFGRGPCLPLLSKQKYGPIYIDSSSSSVGATARCGFWPVEQYLSIFYFLSPTLSILSLPALEDLFLLLLSILSLAFLFVLSLPVLEFILVITYH
jgi:hypothetical protein